MTEENPRDLQIAGKNDHTTDQEGDRVDVQEVRSRQDLSRQAAEQRHGRMAGVQGHSTINHRQNPRDRNKNDCGARGHQAVDKVRVEDS